MGWFISRELPREALRVNSTLGLISVTHKAILATDGKLLPPLIEKIQDVKAPKETQ